MEKEMKYKLPQTKLQWMELSLKQADQIRKLQIQLELATQRAEASSSEEDGKKTDSGEKINWYDMTDCQAYMKLTTKERWLLMCIVTLVKGSPKKLTAKSIISHSGLAEVTIRKVFAKFKRADFKYVKFDADTKQFMTDELPKIVASVEIKPDTSLKPVSVFPEFARRIASSCEGSRIYHSKVFGISRNYKKV